MPASLPPVDDPPPSEESLAFKPRDFAWFRDYIYREAGIALKESKQAMLAARLGRRLRALSLESFSDYIYHLENKDSYGAERRELINAVTTNKTDFFRENHHFDFVRSDLIPFVRERALQGWPRRLRIWSAGCSTGEEPYTLAMVLREAFGSLIGWDVSIVASDIDTQVLATASEGIYTEERLRPVPPELRNKYFQRGKNGSAGLWRARPELKDMIEWKHLNLNDEPWPLTGKFDAIFCRNVIIYFDRPTQTRLFDRMSRQLESNGYLFLGHSESLIGVSDRFTLLRGTVHRLRARAGAAPSETASDELPVAKVAARAPRRTAPPPMPAPRRIPSETAPPSEPLERMAERRIVVGEVCASREPLVIRTLLGSCVSACLYDPGARIGGSNHFLLPAAGNDDASARYGVHAMELLINQILRLGGNRARLVAKVFGGAAVMSAMSGSVPAANTEFVRRFLEKEGIPIVAERLGGNRGREVFFNTQTGQARVRQLANVPAALLAQHAAEVRRLAQLDDAPDDRVTLF